MKHSGEEPSALAGRGTRGRMSWHAEADDLG